MGKRSKTYATAFLRFGEVTDVYMGKKKDTRGKNFAFVKFRNVGDIGKLESEMQEIICGGKLLSVNISRYDRSKQSLNPHSYWVKARPRSTVSHLDPNSSKLHVDRNMNGTRTFAEVTCGAKPAASVLPSPIVLKPGNPSKNWISDAVLVGEALSLDHMSALSDCFTIGDDYIVDLKYLGGLNVGLSFKNSSLAKEFLDDTGRWIEWFQWMVQGDGNKVCQDRIAWIKIIGLPLRCWSDDNINFIVNTFGKILVPQEEMGPCMDASIIQVGILTKRRCWINEDIAVADLGNYFNIGIVEFERNWTPIRSKFNVSDGNGDDTSDDDSEGEVDRSDSDMNVDGEDDVNSLNLEEGEIPQLEDEIPRGSEEGEIPQIVDEIPRDSVPEIDASKPLGTPVPEYVQETIDIPGISTINDKQQRVDETCLDSASSAPNNGYVDLDPIGNMEHGPVFNCSFLKGFGPFTSTMPEAHSSLNLAKHNLVLMEEPPQRKVCRSGKIKKSQNRFCPYDRLLCSEPPPQLFDLNNVPSKDANIDESITPNQEVTRTVEIGTVIGFCIEQGDPTLAQIIEEHGELAGNQ